MKALSDKGKLKKFWIEELTRPTFEEWLEYESAPVVIVGIGSLEQHGPHLPLGTDSLFCRAFLHDIASQTNSVCVQPSLVGYSPHHMGFKGTITFSGETLSRVLMDTIESLSVHGVKRVLLVSCHGGNNKIMDVIVEKGKRHFGVMVARPDLIIDTDFMKEIRKKSLRGYERHSGPEETAMALHLFQNLVEMWRLKKYKPTLNLDPKLKEFLDPDRDDYNLVSQVLAACDEPDAIDFSSSGIYGGNDPRTADLTNGRKAYEERINVMVKFIKIWKTIPIPPAYRDGASKPFYHK